MLTRVVVAVAVLATAGCKSYRPTAPLPQPATQVRVTFATPRNIVAVSPAGDAQLLGNVTELHGSIVRAQLDTRLDSIRIRLGSARAGKESLLQVPDGAIATVPRDVTVRMDQRSVDPWKTAGFGIGMLAAAAAATVVLAFVLFFSS